MATQQSLRAQAAYLLTLARQERRNGNSPYADRLTFKAAEYLDQAEAAEVVREPRTSKE